MMYVHVGSTEANVASTSVNFGSTSVNVGSTEVNVGRFFDIKIPPNGIFGRKNECIVTFLYLIGPVLVYARIANLLYLWFGMRLDKMANSGRLAFHIE